jgi:hypothetical protein
MRKRRYSNSVIALGIWFVILGMVLFAIGYGSSDLSWLAADPGSTHGAGVGAARLAGTLADAGRLWPVPIVGAGVLLFFTGARRTSR